MALFNWIDYSDEYAILVESWLDDEAVKFTGIDQGWAAYYDYCINDLSPLVNGEIYIKIACDEKNPFGIFCLCNVDGTYSISEIFISPEKRGMGYGSKALQDMLLHSEEIFGVEIVIAKTVIFPNNTASKKAFEKAGFEFESAHPDGDAWYYIYRK
ncbi:MAG: GNAT family N-acetyltransferase [Clostridia bacterium]|nr:GNAT family N-acetyltransferase [Clostridia bacterium]